VRLGDAKEVVRAYLDDQEHRYRESLQRELVQEPASAATPVEIEAVELVGRDGVAKDVFAAGEQMTVRIYYNARTRIPWPLFNIRIFHGARDILEASMLIDGPVVEAIEGRGLVECRLASLPLTPKVYEVVIFARSKEGIADIVPMRTYAVFQVSDHDLGHWPLRGPMAINHLRQGSPVYVRRTWHFFHGERREDSAPVPVPADAGALEARVEPAARRHGGSR